MESNSTTCKTRDILSSPRRVFVLYWLPTIAIVVAGAPAITSGWRTAVWTVALATMGGACTVNALRCGRVHCYLTGPFFFLMAVVALLHGLGVLRLGGYGWNLLGLITLIGAVALWFLPEMFLGRYRKGRAGGGGDHHAPLRTRQHHADLEPSGGRLGQTAGRRSRRQRHAGPLATPWTRAQVRSAKLEN